MTRADPGLTKAIDYTRQLVGMIDKGTPLGAVLVLLHLYQNPRTTLHQLRDALGLTSVVASRSIHHWGTGLISMEIDPADKRRRILELTTQGETLVKELVSGFA